MAIQLPTLKRFDPGASAAPETGKIIEQQPNVTQGAENAEKTLQAVGNEQENFVRRLQENAAETKAQELANKKEEWAKGQIGSLRKLQGDPTQPYADYNEQSQKYNQSLIDSNKDLDERTQSLLNQKLMGVDRRTNDTMALQQGVQYQSYQKGVTSAAVANAQDNLLNYSSLVATGDPEGLNKFASAVQAIRDPIITQGKTNGLVTYKDNPDQLDKDGNPTKSEVYSPILEREMKVAVGKAVSQSIITLNASGQTDAAKTLMDKYEDELTAQQRETLTKDHSTAIVKTQASAIADSMRGLPVGDAIKKVDADPKMSPEVRIEAKRLLDQQASYAEKALKAQQAKTYGTLSSLIEQQGEQGLDFIQNGQGQTLFKQLDRKQQKAIKQQISAPDVSDDDAKTHMLELLKDGKLGQLQPKDFQLAITDLNQKDRDRYSTLYQAANKPDAGKQFKATQWMAAEADRQMLGMGMIKKFGNSYDKKSAPIRAKAFDDITDIASQMPGSATPSDLKRAVQEYVANTQKGIAFKPPEPVQKFQSAPQLPPAQAAAAKQVKQTDFGDDAIIAARAAFQQKYKRPYDVSKPGDTTALKALIPGTK